MFSGLPAAAHCLPCMHPSIGERHENRCDARVYVCARSIEELLQALGGRLLRLRINNGWPLRDPASLGCAGAVARHCGRLEALAADELTSNSEEPLPQVRCNCVCWES